MTVAAVLTLCAAVIHAQPEQPAETTAPSPAPGSAVVLRHGQTPPAGDVIAVALEGIKIGADEKSAAVMDAGRVLRVTGEQAGAWSAIEDQAQRVWRAGVRLDRGDAPAAEPLFESLFETLRGRPGPTTATVAEGLLRCRVRRGSHVTAIEPWLVCIASREADSGWSSAEAASPVIDAGTGLAPALPPIWVSLPPVQVYASRDATAFENTTADILSGLYRHAARHETGWKDEPMPVAPGAVGDGPELVMEVVRARTDATEGRESARAALRERLAHQMPGWKEAWCRAGLGRSLILEEGREARLLGVVQLLHVPARLEREHPYLAGLCLAEAAVTLGELGHMAAADRMRQEFLNMYPDHPATAWPPIRDWAVTTPPSAPSIPQGDTP